MEAIGKDLKCTTADAKYWEIGGHLVVVAMAVGAAHKAVRSGGGGTLVRELNRLSDVLDNPRRPVLAILGGELSEEKLAMAEAIARRSEVLLLGGEMCLPCHVLHGPVDTYQWALKGNSSRSLGASHLSATRVAQHSTSNNTRPSPRTPLVGTYSSPPLTLSCSKRECRSCCVLHVDSVVV